VKKILVVALDNLGDAVMASAVLKPLKSLHPSAEIGMWVKNYAGGLFAGHSLVEYLHASDPFWDKAPGRKKGGFGPFVSAWEDVRACRYDAALILNTEWRRSFACALARIPERIGYDRRQSGPFLTRKVPMPGGSRHFVDDHRALIEAWSGAAVKPEDCVPFLEPSTDEERWWRDFSAKFGLNAKEFFAVHLFSGDEKKDWPLAKWEEILEKRSGSAKFVLICGPNEEFRLEPLRPVLGKKSIVLMKAPTLAQMKAVLAQAKLFIGPDSGPGHVAAALGTPVVSLFGNTQPERSRPMGRSAVRVLEKYPIRDLPVAAVLAEMDR
jgi:ADP-heptose:LPS heptosyltransferase